MTAAAARSIVMHWPWGAPMGVTLADGTRRAGALKFRSRRGFTLDDSIATIRYEDVAAIDDMVQP